MKIIQLITIGLMVFAITSTANARRYDRDYTYAQVVDVQPIYEVYRVPQNRRVCQDTRNHNRNYNNSSQRSSGGGAVLGGIIGGLLGNRFGDGRGRDASTAVGIIAGAAIGSQASKNQNYNNRRNKRCYTQKDYYEEERVTGYDVSYDFNGRVYHTKMHNHPGERVRINVNVNAVEY
jgi:uncharacterized protein YcfJ